MAFVLSVRERRRMLDAGLHDDRVAAAMWISGAATALLVLGVVLLAVIPTIAIAAGTAEVHRPAPADAPHPASPPRPPHPTYWR